MHIRPQSGELHGMSQAQTAAPSNLTTLQGNWAQDSMPESLPSYTPLQRGLQYNMMAPGSSSGQQGPYQPHAPWLSKGAGLQRDRGVSSEAATWQQQQQQEMQNLAFTGNNAGTIQAHHTQQAFNAYYQGSVSAGASDKPGQLQQAVNAPLGWHGT
jgi:hypothetical protein